MLKHGLPQSLKSRDSSLPGRRTRLKTPAGSPESWTISANSIELSAAISLGFSTNVQPVASAGATLDATWFSGQFHGVISPQTPIGSRRTIPSPIRSSNR